MMSATAENASLEFADLMPGWTEAAWLAFTTSPANRSALLILTRAEQLRADIRRHLAEFKLADADIVAAAGVEASDRLRDSGTNAEFARLHMRGFLYALNEFCLTVSDHIPVPDPEPDQADAEEGGGS